MGINKGISTSKRIKTYSIGNLPPPATLGDGTTVIVTTPYGENTATVVNGAYRYLMPFVTTWDKRPWAGLVPAGTELQVTDYAHQKWVSDGINWRPAQGRAILKELHGLTATGRQLAQLSGVSSGIFTIPGGCKIPAGMIIPHSRLYVQADGIKLGVNGTANWRVFLGTTNSASDSQMTSFNMINANGINAVSSSAAKFGTATDRYYSRNWQGEGYSSGSYNTMWDRIGNVNTAADMWVNVGIGSANAADVFNLVSLQIVLGA